MTDAPTPSRRNRLPLLAVSVLVGVGLGYAGVAGYRAMQKPIVTVGPCSAAVTQAARLAPLIRGEVAALTAATAPLKIPDLTFEDARGAKKTLADFRGKTVLLNLWATWCVPCRKEMPALNDLQKNLGSADFEVVAINIDTRDGDKPKAFFTEAKLGALGYFTDKTARVFQDLKSVGRAVGMPTSVLLDGQGCEIATIAGPAEWNSPDAVSLIEAALRK